MEHTVDMWQIKGRNIIKWSVICWATTSCQNSFSVFQHRIFKSLKMYWMNATGKDICWTFFLCDDGGPHFLPQLVICQFTPILSQLPHNSYPPGRLRPNACFLVVHPILGLGTITKVMTGKKKMAGQKYTGKNILVYEIYRNVVSYATWIFRLTRNCQASQSQNNKLNLTLTAQTDTTLPTS